MFKVTGASSGCSRVGSDEAVRMQIVPGVRQLAAQLTPGGGVFGRWPNEPPDQDVELLLHRGGRRGRRPSHPLQPHWATNTVYLGQRHRDRTMAGCADLREPVALAETA
jgi:hypothetical protein